MYERETQLVGGEPGRAQWRKSGHVGVEYEGEVQAEMEVFGNGKAQRRLGKRKVS
jgi:hypothetical protein